MNILIKSLTVLAATMPAIHAVTFVQWDIGSGGNGHYYGLTDLSSNWTLAESAAIIAGGHLASITSAAEQNFIVSTFLSDAMPVRPLWIGLTDVPNGVGSINYTNWTTGEPLTYTAWDVGEPNNGANNEDYVAMNWHRAAGDLSSPKGGWNDVPLNGTIGIGADGPYFGVVEVVPEPSSTLLLVAGFALRLNARLQLRLLPRKASGEQSYRVARNVDWTKKS